ncbi:uncharacterized protein LOC107366729 [Tetranychus urticae]|uniref:Uncharacterized protein n=1 Tax=Tetranychus urticae TaxID=32264 RepID=T1KS83_TETUR|nr:uncharacterized protein LOC107366729 [Tetranychus urticae]
MKYSTGLIFMVTLINVSICSSMRELDFMKSLYPYTGIPKPIFITLVNRRIYQLNSECKNETLSDATKAFCESTDKSLSLLVNWATSKGTKGNNQTVVSLRDEESLDLFEFYEQTVEILNKVYPHLNIASVDDYSTNSLASIDIYHFPKNKFQALIDAYIGDIILVCDYEESNGNSKRINMEIFDSLTSLSKEVQNLSGNYWIDQHIALRALDQCLKRFAILIKLFRRDFLKN